MSVTFDTVSLIVGGCRPESLEDPETPDVPDNPDNLDAPEPPSEGKVTNCKFGV